MCETDAQGASRAERGEKIKNKTGSMTPSKGEGREREEGQEEQ